MTTTPWRRFSVRLGASDTDAAPYDGVPGHLLRPLRSWVQAVALKANGYIARTVCLQLRIDVPSGNYPAGWLAEREGMELLDIVDAILSLLSEIDEEPDEVRELRWLLDDSGSAYCVSEDRTGLEERITPTARDAVKQAVDDAASEPAAGSAASHLATAWQCAYGLHPDAVRAYSESIKAVESAAHAIVQPNHARATLGSMLGEIDNARAKYQTTLSTPAGKDPIAVVEAMMRALWDGQTSRHGSQTATVPETLEAARVGVHLAATLVQCFTSGAVIRNP